MKTYEVRYSVRIVVEVEADNKDDARDAAARVIGGLREDGLDGIRLGAAECEGVADDEEDQWEWDYE